MHKMDTLILKGIVSIREIEFIFVVSNYRIIDK